MIAASFWEYCFGNTDTIIPRIDVGELGKLTLDLGFVHMAEEMFSSL